MLSSIYTKAYFISKYSLSSILIRNPCFYNKIKKGGSSGRKKQKAGSSCRKGAAMQKEKQRVEIIFINLGEETKETELRNEDVYESAEEKKKDAGSYASTLENTCGLSSVREISKYEIVRINNHQEINIYHGANIQ